MSRAAGHGGERDELREKARALGELVELRFLDVPFEELWSRLERRNADPDCSVIVSRSELEQWAASTTACEPSKLTVTGSPARRRPRTSSCSGDRCAACQMTTKKSLNAAYASGRVSPVCEVSDRDDATTRRLVRLRPEHSNFVALIVQVPVLRLPTASPPIG